MKVFRVAAFGIAIVAFGLCTPHGAFANVCVYRPPVVHDMRGLVTDPDGRGFPNVEIFVSKDDTLIAGQKSTQDGHFAFANLPKGTYHVRFTAPGFSDGIYIIHLRRLWASSHALHVTMALGGSDCFGEIDLRIPQHR